MDPEGPTLPGGTLPEELQLVPVEENRLLPAIAEQTMIPPPPPDFNEEPSTVPMIQPPRSNSFDFDKTPFPSAPPPPHPQNELDSDLDSSENEDSDQHPPPESDVVSSSTFVKLKEDPLYEK